MKYLTYLAISFSILLAGCGGGADDAGPLSSGGHQTDKNSVELKILACGDSTMNATTTEATQAERMTQLFQQGGRSVFVEDASVAGKRLDELLRGLDGRNPPLNQLLAQKPDFRIVLENFAINDANSAVTESEFRANLLEFIGTVRAAGKVPVLITPTRAFTRNMYEFEEKFPRFIQVIRDVALQESVYLIDTNSEFVDLTESDYVDAVHPKSPLYGRIAQFYVRELNRIIADLQ